MFLHIRGLRILLQEQGVRTVIVDEDFVGRLLYQNHHALPIGGKLSYDCAVADGLEPPEVIARALLLDGFTRDQCVVASLFAVVVEPVHRQGDIGEIGEMHVREPGALGRAVAKVLDTASISASQLIF